MIEILKGVLRFCRCLLQFLLIELPLQLVGAVVLLPALLYTRHKYNSRLWVDIPDDFRVPFILKFFDCFDIYNESGRDYKTYAKIFCGPLLEHYNWLAWRNPTNYFCYKYLGFQFPNYIVYDMKMSNAGVGDSTGKREGWRVTEIQTGHYEYLLVKKVSSKSCIYIRFGWKIGEYNKPSSWCQQVFTISYRSYSGV